MDTSGETMPEAQNGAHTPITRAGPHGLSINREASTVAVVLKCTDEYAAIELYERLVASAKAGKLHLDINATKPR